MKATAFREKHTEDRGRERMATGERVLRKHDAGRRVLVVDDNWDAADLLARALRMMGHETEVAHDGPTAVARADAFHPDVVLLDIGLPLMDGYQVARQIRSERPDVLLVAITGYGQSSDVERAYDAGFDHHMVKPVELRAVRDLLDQDG